VSEFLYAAAPRGVKVVAYSGRRFIDWRNDDRTEVRASFAAALYDAVRLSYGTTQAYEVVALDPSEHVSEWLVSNSSLLASCGIVYEMVDDDDLQARVTEQEGIHG
jgi:hypothetical protein